MRSVSSAMALASCAYLIIAMAWPHVAERMLQMLLATLAFGWVGARIYRSSFGIPMSHDVYSPFERAQEASDQKAGPAALQVLTHRLRAADDVLRAKRAAIPGEAAEIVHAEASRRLVDRHGVVLREPQDHARARELLSERSWALIQPMLADAPASAGDPTLRGPIPMSDLSRILDDLENL